MSLLAASIGNAHTLLGLLDDGEVVAHWLVSTDERRSADEWAVLVRGLLRGHLEEVEGLALCSTVPAALSAWRAMTSRHFAEVPTVVVEPGVRTGIALQVDNPRELGTDRTVNAAAAAHLYGGPAIVVSFTGTATLFDVVNAAGAYVGGAIVPGLEISAEALARRGAQLRTVEMVRPRTVIGKNTTEALQSGLVLGLAATVEGLVRRMIRELGNDAADVSVIAAGYLSHLVVDECEVFTAHNPWLTLVGLERVFLRNT